MSTITTIIKRRPVPIYFILTFVISWGLVLLVIGGPTAIPGTPAQVEKLLPIVILAMLVGPGVSGLLVTALAYGKAGFRDLSSRLRTWRVDARWYAVALLTAPLSVGLGLIVLSLFSPAFIPTILTPGGSLSMVLPGIVGGLVVGFLEELGWTGLATPALRRRYGIFATGIAIGVVWGAWHLLTNLLWATDSYSGAFSLPVHLALRGLIFMVGQLAAYRVLLVWVHDHTLSLPVVMLMHAALTASALILQPAAMSGDVILLIDLVQAASMWLVVAAVAALNRGQLLSAPPVAEKVFN